MKIEAPVWEDIPALRALWQQAFGDDDRFLDAFFATGFSPDRCRCIRQGQEILAVLYWFDCTLDGEKWAYLYAVATRKEHRGKGLCSALMEDTHTYLAAQGYIGTALVPGEKALFVFYEKLGYRRFGGMDILQARAGEPVALRKLTVSQYADLRPRFLPQGGLKQGGMEFLGAMTDFYAGNGFLVAVSRQEPFFAAELLGDLAAAPGILAALQQKEGRFRVAGKSEFAMCHRFFAGKHPTYLGIAFD